MIANGVEKMEFIQIRNAYENNLKNINIDIPLNVFTCVTGCSGGGKSSLVFDTIYAESQRAFFESMSGNMFGQKLMNKPKVGSIKNLRPALNVSQTYYNFNPRSTVGTVTEISYYLRAMFSLIKSAGKNEVISENYFSANNPLSYCKNCKGTGEEYVISENAIIPNREKKLKDGAIIFYQGNKNSLEYKSLMALCEHYGIDAEKKISELTKTELYNLLYNENDIRIHLSFKNYKGSYRQKNVSLKGVIAELNEKLSHTDNPSTYRKIAKYLRKQPCHICRGLKLNSEILKIKILNKNISEVELFPFLELPKWINDLEIYYTNSKFYSQVLQISNQIKKKCQLITDLDIGYLTCARTIPSLSGGEIQRIRIANQLNCPLKDLIYILDEPCKGLHYLNTKNIITASQKLIEKGNTIISIEHNKQYIAAAENVIELGYEGGQNGGYLISVQKQWHNFKYKLEFKPPNQCNNYFELININFRNIKKQNVKIPLERITCITGVSGSGKSSLICVIANCFSQNTNFYCESIFGIEKIKKIIEVNQKPIGKNPRSIIATYLEIYDSIRDLFANTEDAKKRSLGNSNFSINVNAGRCECCQGTGIQKIELNFLPDSYIVCPLCNGKRFENKILAVKYKNKNISEILDLPIKEIINLFEKESIIYITLRTMIEIGLGYLSLGRTSISLSGGEAQRIKLAKALIENNKKNTLFLLDEPTSGLDDSDIKKIEKILLKLVDNKNTIVMVEHNPEFIAKIADYILDFGAFGGNAGGKICAFGLPKKVFNNPESSWIKFKSLSPL